MRALAVAIGAVGVPGKSKEYGTVAPFTPSLQATAIFAVLKNTCSRVRRESFYVGAGRYCLRGVLHRCLPHTCCRGQALCAGPSVPRAVHIVSCIPVRF